MEGTQGHTILVLDQARLVDEGSGPGGQVDVVALYDELILQDIYFNVYSTVAEVSLAERGPVSIK